jgi:hypothetical protein
LFDILFTQKMCPITPICLYNSYLRTNIKTEGFENG